MGMVWCGMVWYGRGRVGYELYCLHVYSITQLFAQLYHIHREIIQYFLRPSYMIYETRIRKGTITNCRKSSNTHK